MGPQLFGLWIASGLIVFAFRPTGSELDGRIRFTIADLILLTALISLSLGVLANQKAIVHWISAKEFGNWP